MRFSPKKEVFKPLSRSHVKTCERDRQGNVKLGGNIKVPRSRFLNVDMSGHFSFCNRVGFV